MSRLEGMAEGSLMWSLCLSGSVQFGSSLWDSTDAVSLGWVLWTSGCAPLPPLQVAPVSGMGTIAISGWRAWRAGSDHTLPAVTMMVPMASLI